jgi:hypothetical protein
MKLELLALKWAVTEKFKEYLHDSPFVVFTDNNPLSYFMTTAKLGATEQRWATQLAQYNFTIKYKPGRNNQNADSLSRRPQTDRDVDDMKSEEITQVLGFTVFPEEIGCKLLKTTIHNIKVSNTLTLNGTCEAMSSSHLPSWTKKDLVKAQRDDKYIGRLWDFWNKKKKPSVNHPRLNCYYASGIDF